MNDPVETAGPRADHAPPSEAYEPPTVERHLRREDLEKEFLYGGTETKPSQGN